MIRHASLAACLTAVLLCAVPVHADQWPFDDSVRYERAVLAALVGVGGYNPTSSHSGTSPQETVGIRYLRPDLVNTWVESVGYQLTGSVLSSGSEDIYTVSASILHFLPRSNSFPFDNHLFFGAGISSAMVYPRGAEDLLLPALRFDLGIQSRVRDWHLETSLGIVIGPQRGVYDISGMNTTVASVYHFDP